LQFAQANAQTKNCKIACLSATADFADTKKTKSFKTEKIGMIELKINLKPLIDKNAQLVTGGIFYCRDSAGFRVLASNKLSCNLTGQCFEIGNKNIPPNRYRAF
jgi:hypothetical protein